MFNFGPYQLDQHAFKLTKDGVEIIIEPQVFNTLLMLLENRERVVTKSELLEEIWHGRDVTDQVITRIIYELRKLFGDNSGHSTYIKTVRGKGYQFVAEVSESQQDTHIEIHSTQSKSKNSVYFHEKIPLVLGMLVLVVIGIIVIYQISFSTGSSNEKSSQTKPNIYPIIAILPIETESGNEEVSMLLQSLIEYLYNQLAINLNMKVIHPDSLKHMGDQWDDIWAVQNATRADFIIRGIIESVTNESINLHLRLYKKNNTDELTPFQLGAFKFAYPNNTSELSDLYKQRKVTVRSIVQIIKPGVFVKENGDKETNNPEAYRLVIAAHHISRNDDCSDLQRAEDLLLSAVQRDDEFAYAYYQLFANYFKRVWLCGESIEFHQKAMAVAEQVERLAPNTYRAMYKGMNAIYVESNQVEKAYELSKNANWNNPDDLNHQNYGLRYAGFLELAKINIDRILQLDPFYFSEKPINQAPNALMYQNQFSQYMDLLAEPGSSYHDYYRGLSLTMTGESEVAIEILQGVVDRKSAGIFDRFAAALLLIIKKDESAAVGLIDDIVQHRNVKKHTDGEMNYKVVQLYALAGAKKQALKYLQISVDQGFFPVNYFLVDPALESIRNTDRFAEIIEQATQRHQLFADRFDLKPELKLDSSVQ